MSLIKSISGIRGTIGGKSGEGLTPYDVLSFTAAYVELIKRRVNKDKITIVVGRDGRISGEMVDAQVTSTLVAMGVDVINGGVASTPTVEMAVPSEKADGGIIITASHNPAEWNALKLLNEKGEFLSAKEGEQIIEFAEQGDFTFVSTFQLGKVIYKEIEESHIEQVLSYPLVANDKVKERKFKVVLDAINSVGASIIPSLLEKMGVEVITINETIDGNFAHNPEPLPEHLTELSKRVLSEGAHLGVAVDPDVDRLALICENGEPFGEEYTLVALANYFHQKLGGGATVSNLSSSRALRDITEQAGGSYHPAAVGEVNVVEEMKRVNAILGGEGNGGVIVPDFHYGRDAVVGVALILSYLAESEKSLSQIRATLPHYEMVKEKIELPEGGVVENLLDEIAKRATDRGDQVNRVDGVKIDFKGERRWVHIRKSNTEPILRIYAEAPSEEEAKMAFILIKEWVAQLLS